MDINEKIEILWAENQIMKKMVDYTRAADRNDVELGASVFKEDSYYDCGKNFQGTGRGFFEYVVMAHSLMFESTTHRISNIKINVCGNKAYSECYVHLAAKYNPGDGEQLMNNGRGRYLDEWECVDGEWLIAKRTYVEDMAEIQTCQKPSEAWGGSRDREDLSYDYLSRTE